MSATTGFLCGPDSVSFYPASQEFPKSIYILACVVNAINSVLSVLGNIVILSALRRCQSLHLPSKALLCSLALTDLIVGIVVLPLFIAKYLAIILKMPTYYCTMAVLYGRTSSFVASASLLTIVTIAAERFLAFRLRLRYHAVVTFKRVISTLVLEWIVAAIWAASWFWSAKLNMLFAAVVLVSSCLAVPFFYLRIHRGLRRHFAQIRQQPIAREPDNFNALQYRKTVANMMWIYGLLLLCYMPFLLSLLAIIVVGRANSTRFAVQFSAIAVYFNSSLNPVLYCWRVKELRQKVRENHIALCNVFSCFIKCQTIRQALHQHCHT